MAVLSITVPILDPVLIWAIVKHPNSHLFHRCAAVSLLLLNIYWYTLFFSKWVEEYKAMKAKKTQKVSKAKITSLLTLVHIVRFANKMSEIRKRMGQERFLAKFSSIRSYSIYDSFYRED